MKVVRCGQAQLGFLQQTVPKVDFRKIQHVPALRIGDEEAIFDLKTALGDHDAGFGDRGAISAEGDFNVRRGASAGSHDPEDTYEKDPPDTAHSPQE
jgi:hypothetical protein